MPGRRNAAPLVLLFLLHGLAGLLISLDSQRPFWRRSDAYVTLVLGTCFAQTTLCAYWAALGRAHFAWRWPGAAFLVILSSLAVSLFYGALLGLLLIPAAMLIQWLAIQVPWALLRAKYGWRVSRPAASQPAPIPFEKQFGIMHLLGWTAGVAVLCAAIRGLSSVEAWGLGSSRDMESLALLVAFNTLLSILPLWATLLRHPTTWVAIAVVFYTLALAWFEHMAFSAFAGRGRVDWYLFPSLNLVQLAWLLVSLWLVRWAGYRLVRTGSAASPTAESSTH
jgi:hypothetical protein